MRAPRGWLWALEALQPSRWQRRHPDRRVGPARWGGLARNPDPGWAPPGRRGSAPGYAARAAVGSLG